MEDHISFNHRLFAGVQRTQVSQVLFSTRDTVNNERNRVYEENYIFHTCICPRD